MEKYDEIKENKEVKENLLFSTVLNLPLNKIKALFTPGIIMVLGDPITSGRSKYISGHLALECVSSTCVLSDHL